MDDNSRLVCIGCDKLVELHFEMLEAPQRDVAKSFGFSFTGRVHQLCGTCSLCQRKWREGS